MTDVIRSLRSLGNSFKATEAFLDIRKEDDNFRGGKKKSPRCRGFPETVILLSFQSHPLPGAHSASSLPWHREPNGTSVKAPLQEFSEFTFREFCALSACQPALTHHVATTSGDWSDDLSLQVSSREAREAFSGRPPTSYNLTPCLEGGP